MRAPGRERRAPGHGTGRAQDDAARAGYFLACTCVPEGDLAIASPPDAALYGRATVCGVERLSPHICRLFLDPATALYYHPGQFINLRRFDGLTRSYSLASVPRRDALVEIHVKRLPSGRMSH